MIDRKKFFANIAPTPLPKPRVQSQVNTLDAILDEFERRKWINFWWPAYMMGTSLGEVGRALAPVREGFSATDAIARAYVKRQRYSYAVVINGIVYYGRGLVQVTWLDNYKKLTVLAAQQFPDEKPDFVKNPDLLLQPRWAVWVMFEGMSRGTFTTKKLADYFGPADKPGQFIGKDPIVNARRIINKLDRAVEIGGYAKQFYADMVIAST